MTEILKKKYSNQLTSSKRRKIYKQFYTKNCTIAQIAEEEGISYWQVYRVVNGEVKMNGSPRADKGRRRGKANDIVPKWSLDDFIDLDDFQLFLLMDTLEELATETLSAQEKIRLVKDIEVIQTKIQQRQLQSAIKRPEAELIARIIRRFVPDATNADIIAIYQEELELYLKERK